MSASWDSVTPDWRAWERELAPEVYDWREDDGSGLIMDYPSPGIFHAILMLGAVEAASIVVIVVAVLALVRLGSS